MPNTIASKRFAERWPFAAAVVVLTALALTLSFLPSTVSREAKYFCLFVLGSLWSEVLELRIYRIGYSPKKWQLILLSVAIVFPLRYVFDYFRTSGPYLAAALFLAFQIPLVIMKTQASDPVILDEQPRRGTQIFLYSLFFLIVIAGLALGVRRHSHEPVWEIPLCIFAACYFGWGLYRWIRNRQNTGSPASLPARPTSGPFTPGTPEGTEYGRRLKISVNVLVICLVLAGVDMLFRNEFYGFILPAACFVASVYWSSSLRRRERRAVHLAAEARGDTASDTRNPFPEGTPEAIDYSRRQTIWSQFFLLSIVLALADLVFRQDVYGLILPAAYFVVWVVWIGMVRARQRHASLASTDTPSESL